jgi:hypothetical protein
MCFLLWNLGPWSFALFIPGTALPAALTRFCIVVCNMKQQDMSLGRRLELPVLSYKQSLMSLGKDSCHSHLQETSAHDRP